jgi:hypothetical protein
VITVVIHFAPISRQNFCWFDEGGQEAAASVCPQGGCSGRGVVGRDGFLGSATIFAVPLYAEDASPDPLVSEGPFGFKEHPEGNPAVLRRLSAACG